MSSRLNVRLTVDFHPAPDAAECSSKSTGAHPHEFTCSFSCVASEPLFDSDFESGPHLLSHVQHFIASAKIVRISAMG